MLSPRGGRLQLVVHYIHVMFVPPNHSVLFDQMFRNLTTMCIRDRLDDHDSYHGLTAREGASTITCDEDAPLSRYGPPSCAQEFQRLVCESTVRLQDHI